MEKNIENYDLPPLLDNSTNFILSSKEIDEEKAVETALEDYHA